MDMFPATVHVETVVLLSQQKPDATIEIDLDLDELDATSAESVSYTHLDVYKRQIMDWAAIRYSSGSVRMMCWR